MMPCVFEPCWVDREHFCGSVQDCTETDLWTACRRWGEWTERFSDSARSFWWQNFKYYLSNIPAGDWMLVADLLWSFLVTPGAQGDGDRSRALETVGSWGPHGWGCRRYPTKAHALPLHKATVRRPSAALKGPQNPAGLTPWSWTSSFRN